ncbi:MAG: archaemetzincin [Planctomycetota bacterium]|jgi:archaemetzincin
METRSLLLLLLGQAVAAEATEKTTPRQLAFATRDDRDFEKMGPPRPGDWLARFKERGQTYDRYVASRPVRARKGEVLAFLPVGPFKGRERAVFDRTVAFARLWFDLEVKVLPAKPLPEQGWQRERAWGTQYRTGYFLEHLLPRHRPAHAVCLFGVTMADLFPDDVWNYVFGQASLRGRVGVWSFARYFPRFWGRPESATSDRIALRRACKVVVHEAGHAFGLEHCIYYACNMNGSNSLPESDRRPLRLCPVCLKKLQWNRAFDVLDRYEKLRAFFRRHGFAPEAAWTAGRLQRIRAVR